MPFTSLHSASINNGPLASRPSLLPTQVDYGESLRLVGSTHKLGDWSVERALPMGWTDGNVWVAKLELEEGEEVSFKVTSKLETSRGRGSS